MAFGFAWVAAVGSYVSGRADRIGLSWEILEMEIAETGIEAYILPGCRGTGRSIVLGLRIAVHSGLGLMDYGVGFWVVEAGIVEGSGTGQVLS
jgi:hypothetical protein